MTEERLALSELLEKAGDGDFLRAVAEAVLQLLMEADVEGLIGAGRYERGGERTTWRNGCRDRVLDTRLGSLQLRIPKLRQGSYFPPFLEARKVSEKALIGGDPGGVDRRRVDAAGGRAGAGDGGASGISKSQVSVRFIDIVSIRQASCGSDGQRCALTTAPTATATVPVEHTGSCPPTVTRKGSGGSREILRQRNRR